VRDIRTQSSPHRRCRPVSRQTATCLATSFGMPVASLQAHLRSKNPGPQAIQSLQHSRNFSVTVASNKANRLLSGSGTCDLTMRHSKQDEEKLQSVMLSSMEIHTNDQRMLASALWSSIRELKPLPPPYPFAMRSDKSFLLSHVKPRQENGGHNTAICPSLPSCSRRQPSPASD
jgi:hypothetical protein